MNVRRVLINLSLSVSLAALAVVGAVGCETLGDLGFPRFSNGQSRKEQAEAEVYREKYLIEQSPESLRWLLANVVESGMTVEEVNRQLGQVGERLYEDKKYKLAGEYQEEDIGYRWGPTSDGEVVILFFREGGLVNFDPSEFTTGP